MNFLLVGGNNNGMLERALTQAKITQDVLGKPAVYISTVDPVDEREEEERGSRRDLATGYGLSFIDCRRNITDALPDLTSDSVCIIDSVTALLRNEMGEADDLDFLAVGRVISDLKMFAMCVRSTVFIGHYIFSGTGRSGSGAAYSPEIYRREYFRKGLAEVEKSLAGFCDHVEELSYCRRYRFK